MKALTKSVLAGAIAAAFAAPSMASFDVDLGDKGTIKFGGYIKLDARHVSGDIPYTDYWRSQGASPGSDVSSTNFSVRETRLNTTYTRGDVTAFVEMDFYGGGGNELVSNSTLPRLRHAFIGYKNWKIGHTWSTFMPLISLAEAANFGGAMVGQVFVRQPQIRYTAGGFSFAIENPESYKGGLISSNNVAAGLSGANPEETTPDFIATYSTKGDWGVAQFGALVRKVDEGGADETATALNAAARINFGDDDLRLQINAGDLGRYIGAGQGAELADWNGNGVETLDSQVSGTIAYRHVWGGGWRTNVYGGWLEGDDSGKSRSHIAANLMATVAPGLTAGFELGQYKVDDDSLTESQDSKYFQVMVKFGL